EDCLRVSPVTGVRTCALPLLSCRQPAVGSYCRMTILRKLCFELLFAACAGECAIHAVVAAHGWLTAGHAGVGSRGRGVLGDSELGHLPAPPPSHPSLELSTSLSRSEEEFCPKTIPNEPWR